MITLIVLDSNQVEHHHLAMIDTGFSGFCTLSPKIISELKLVFFEQREFTLGTGEDVTMSLYEGTIIWDGNERKVLIVEADDDALVGMETMEGYTLFIDAIDGGEVRIQAR